MEREKGKEERGRCGCRAYFFNELLGPGVEKALERLQFLAIFGSPLLRQMETVLNSTTAKT